MAGSAERAKKLKEMRERAKQTDKTVNRAPFAPKDDVKVSPGSKVKFQEINLSDAETLFKLYEMETQNLISQI